MTIFDVDNADPPSPLDAKATEEGDAQPGQTAETQADAEVDPSDQIIDFLGENEPLVGVNEDGTLQEPAQAPAKDVKAEDIPKEGADKDIPVELSKDDTVPLATFLELKGKVKTLQEQLNAQPPPVQQDSAAPTVPAEDTITYEDDRDGFFLQQINSLKQENTRLQTAQTDANAQTEQTQLLDNFKIQVRSQVQGFAAQNPDFSAAHKIVRQAQENMIRAEGLTDQLQINAMVDNWELQFSYKAMKNGANPGQAFYTLAEGLGYKKAPVTPDGNKIAALKESQVANRSLGNGGNSDAAPVPSPEGIDEFVAATNELFTHLN